jgi:hypothetical protein
VIGLSSVPFLNQDLQCVLQAVRFKNSSACAVKSSIALALGTNDFHVFSLRFVEEFQNVVGGVLDNGHCGAMAELGPINTGFVR